MAEDSRSLFVFTEFQMLTGQCHCGNIRFTSSHSPDSVTECNCSICARYGARWAYFSASAVQITVDSAPAVGYSWGDRMIAFQHCPLCGCVTHYTAGEQSHDDYRDRVAVNTRMCDPASIAALPIRHFDGADSFSYQD